MTQENFIEEVLPLKDRIFRFAVSKVGSLDQAEEIVQDVFLKLWRQRDRLDTVTNKEAWCIRCTQNLIIDRHRARRPNSNIEHARTMTSGDEADHSMLHQDLMRQVEEALSTLPKKQQDVFRLRDLVGYSNVEIEEILNMGQSEVRVNLCRARKTIRQLLTKKINNGVRQKAPCP